MHLSQINVVFFGEAFCFWRSENARWEPIFCPFDMLRAALSSFFYISKHIFLADLSAIGFDSGEVNVVFGGETGGDGGGGERFGL